ncbi:MAG TPA: hypothetical protein VM165_16145 [Planctomycetaceae bacterium]|nr:hypothetical protein [Planctomycetaceae bacterium]
MTEGKPKLVAVESVAGFNDSALLAAAAGLEQGSEHPLAAAIVHGAVERNIRPAAVRDFMSVTGRGFAGMSRCGGWPSAIRP